MTSMTSMFTLPPAASNARHRASVVAHRPALTCQCPLRYLSVSAQLHREREPDHHVPHHARPNAAGKGNAYYKKPAKQHTQQRHHDPFGFDKLVSSPHRPFPSRPPRQQQLPPPAAAPPRSFALTDLARMRTTDISSGDLVLTVRKGQPQLGAVIDHGVGLRSLLGTGFHMTHGPSEVWFRVPGLYNLASDKHTFIQVDVRATSRRAHQLRLDMADQFAAAYKHFTSAASGSAGERESVPLADYLTHVYGADTQLTVDQVLAAVLHLISDPERYLTSFATLHQRAMVQFRPMRSLATLHRGQQLIASASASEDAFNESSLAEFLVKCRTLLDFNAAPATKDATVASSDDSQATPPLPTAASSDSETAANAPNATPPAMDWTPDDLTLLACLREVALGPRASLSAFGFVGTHILGPLGYKPDVRFPGPTLSLLLDLGVYSRLDNFPLYAQAYTLQPLDGLGFASADALAREAEQKTREVKVVDGLDAHRRVFGAEVQVYTVDDPGAHEIDDGISIEMTPAGEVDWIHVHVADPTAYIERDSTLAKFAVDRGQTVYFPEGTFPMLPGTIGSGIMSLASSSSSSSSSGAAEPVRALTVSFRVNGEGDVVDARVAPSVVHTVIPRPYDLVDSVLAFKDMPGVALPSVDAAKIAPPRVLRSDPSLDALVSECRQVGTGGPITDTQAKSFQALQRVAKQHAKYRHVTGGAFNPASQAAMVSATVDGGMPALTPLETALPRTRPADPLVDVQLHRDLLPLSPARQMIAELMIMAGRAAAMVAKDANLAVPFRSQPAPDLSRAYLPWSTTATTHAFASQVHPTSYTLNLRDTLTSLSLMLPADQAATPGPHYQMGLSASPGYVKITSPLRRAVDLLGHWQLKLHFAHTHGLATTHKIMHADELTRAMAAMRERERVIKSVQRAREAWWALEALRLRQAVNRDLTYMARVVRLLDRPPVALGVAPGAVGVGALVHLVDAGVKAMVWMPGVASANGSVEVGEWVSVWIKQVCPIEGQVMGEVVRRWTEVDPKAD